MQLVYVGNFAAPHSTENEIAKALRALGHDVVCLQENDRRSWTWLCGADDPRADLVLWTRTGWDWPAATGWSWEEAVGHQSEMLKRMASLGIPTVGVHLDRWWGLDREGQVDVEPFFRCDRVFTADGGHDEQWRAAGVEHRWFPPAVSEFECVGGRRRERFAADVAFVGSHRLRRLADGTWDGYHDEWAPLRSAMLEDLRATYGERFRCFPKREAIRGPALRDLYASVKVVVGDSCLSGGITHYCSDRIPETLGRGGFLVHPDVEGVTDGTLYRSGEHLATYPLGDHVAMREVIDHYLDEPDERETIAEAGRAHVLEHHTYTRRMGELLATLGEEGLL